MCLGPTPYRIIGFAMVWCALVCSPTAMFKDEVSVINQNLQNKSPMSITPFDISQFGTLAQSFQQQATNMVGAGRAGLRKQAEEFAMSDLQDRMPTPGSNKDMAGYGKPNTLIGGPQDEITFGADGFASNVPRSLIGSESSGDWRASNNEKGSSNREGHYGILQFGLDRLDDAKKAGIIPQDMTPEQFMDSEKAQISTSNWHFNDIDKRIRKRGFDKLIGQKIGGTPVSWDGMRSMAHLGGFGGLSNFINSGGKSNPSDTYGTSLSDYGKQHQN